MGARMALGAESVRARWRAAAGRSTTPAASRTLSGSGSWFTALCAFAYLVARVLYVPAYAYGWSPGRSLIYAVGAIATFAMILAALF